MLTQRDNMERFERDVRNTLRKAQIFVAPSNLSNRQRQRATMLELTMTETKYYNGTVVVTPFRLTMLDRVERALKNAHLFKVERKRETVHVTRLGGN